MAECPVDPNGVEVALATCDLSVKCLAPRKCTIFSKARSLGRHSGAGLFSVRDAAVTLYSSADRTRTKIPPVTAMTGGLGVPDLWGRPAMPIMLHRIVNATS